MRPPVSLAMIPLLLSTGAACNGNETSSPADAPDENTPDDELPGDPAPPPDEFGDESGVYQEPYRSQFHFSPPFGWMNDPNGLVFFEDEYHLFYQYNPYAISFGNIGWGHAVSPDLMHWDFLPVAIPPDGDNLIFSGSAVVDQDDTSGLCSATAEDPQACLVAIYTTLRPLDGITLQTQDVAHSTDQGRTWIRRLEPVIDRGIADFRDPKVFWHEETGRWIQVVALPPERLIAIYGSDNLLDWDLLSEFGPAGAVDGIWECPDLVALPLDGGDEQRWVMKVDLNPGHIAGGSGGQYFLGDFDGVRFQPDEVADPLWVDYGPDFYCATTFSNVVDPEGRLTWLGWMNNWNYASEIPTDPWRGTMTLPRTIELATTPEGPRLVQTPVEQVETLRMDEQRVSGETIDSVDEQLDIPLTIFDASIGLDMGEASDLDLRLEQPDGSSAIVFRYEESRGVLTMIRPPDGNAETVEAFYGEFEAPVALVDGRLDLRMLVDRHSIELFAEGGRIVLTALQLPLERPLRLRLAATGQVSNVEAVLHPLRSVWR
jgi:fructan beta-fructosidase